MNDPQLNYPLYMLITFTLIATNLAWIVNLFFESKREKARACACMCMTRAGGLGGAEGEEKGGKNLKQNLC